MPPGSQGCAAGQYVPGEVITLTAHPAAGYQILSWTGTNDDSSKALTNTVTMPAAHTASVAYGQIAPTATATPGASTLPHTGDPGQGSLALVGLALALGSALALRLARAQPPSP